MFLTWFLPPKAADEELPEAAEEAPEVEEQSAEAKGPPIRADEPATMFGLRSWRLGNLREFFIFQPSAVIHLYLPKDMKLGPLKDASLFFIRHRQRRRRKSSK